MGAEQAADEPIDDPVRTWPRAVPGYDGGTPTASLVIRVSRISAGTVVTLLGLAMLVLPGPGLFLVATGLSLLAIDVPFARRLLHRVRRQLPQDADGGTPTWLLLTMVGGLAVGLSVSAALIT